MPAPTSNTGLTGTVLRGPITPVCTQNVPCDAPFSASFTVQQNGRSMGQFQSDADGHFMVALAPGDYSVVPAPDAPVRPQAQPATVGPSGYTTVTLHFDTGLR
jgi:hypothetical protein